VCRVGWGGATSSFWRDIWCGGVSFRDRFQHLYDLAVDKTITVRNMFLYGWEKGGEAWRWWRRLWMWEEEMLDKCRSLLLTVSLQDTISYVWQWHLDPTWGYSVHGVYGMLTYNEHVHVPPNLDLIWHKQVPLKVSDFAWRMLRDRLPTKTNLENRSVISPEARLCVA